MSASGCHQPSVLAIEHQADLVYAALISHMDDCLTCQAAGGVQLYMCEPGCILYHQWNVVEHRAAQARVGEFDLVWPLRGR
jgi:hypothetical protein